MGVSTSPRPTIAPLAASPKTSTTKPAATPANEPNAAPAAFPDTTFTMAPKMVTWAPGSAGDYTFEAVAVRPQLGKQLEKHAGSFGAPFLVSGPMTRVAANAGWKTGAPVLLGAGLKFRPVTSFAGGIPAAPPTALTQGAAGAWREAPAGLVKTGELAEALRGPLEELAKTVPGLDASISVVGFITTTPRAWNAIMKPGPKNKAEVFFAGSQLTVAAVEVAAIFVPALHPWKHALAWSGVILKCGEKFYAILVKPEKGKSSSGTNAKPKR